MDKLKHISFDLDGTIIESKELMKEAWNYATKKLSISCDFANYESYIGLPFLNIMKVLGLEKYGKELEEIYFSYTSRFSSKIMLINGAADALDLCKSLGYSTSIITSKNRVNSEEIIGRLNLHYDYLICGNDYSKGKPSTAPWQALNKDIMVQPQEILYIGDMIFDLQFAQNYGAHFVHFSNNGSNLLPSTLVQNFTSIERWSQLKSLI
jgi:phosphoglycolate phosphatase-like HAD superfamily hydrolase